MKWIAVLAALLTAIPSLTQAQTGDLVRPGRTSLAFEVLRPEIELPFGEASFFSVAAFFSGHYTLQSGMRLIGELPMAHLSVEDAPLVGDETSTTIGNPYFGVQLPSGEMTYEAGLRLPMTSDDELAGLVGLVSDLDRLEAFAPNTLPISAGVRWRTIKPSGLTVGLNGSPSLLINTDPEAASGLQDDVELSLGYGADVGYTGAGARAGARLSGRAAITDDGSFDERTFHQIGVFGEFTTGNLRPGVQIRFPLDDDTREVVDWIIGLSLQIALH